MQSANLERCFTASSTTAHSIA